MRIAVAGAAVFVAALSAATSGPSAAGTTPAIAAAPPDPEAVSLAVTQDEPMVHVFDTTALGGSPTYVNDHTIVQADDGSWHLFGIFHREPMLPDDSEYDLVHAIAAEPDPARWENGAFTAAPAPWTIALHADRAHGETHAWAPHVVRANGRYVMVWQAGGPSDDRAGIRIAESDDLHRWSRIGDVPLFEDFCEARDPMLVPHGDTWSLYYTRCESTAHKVSGVARRTSRDLVHWSEPQMALTLATSAPTSNSAFTESPFVFERGGYWWLSVTSYPVAWDGTVLYRSKTPFAFDATPVTRLRAHAAEWISDAQGRLWMTHAGPGQRGVWLARVRL